MLAFNIQQSWNSKFFVSYLESHFTGAEKDFKKVLFEIFGMCNGGLLPCSLRV
jgi:hypothetical protein